MTAPRPVAYESEKVGWFRRWTNRRRGLPEYTCHIDWPRSDHPDMRQGMAFCRYCGGLHRTRSRLSEQALDELIGGRR
jgi:hypothetical protein